MSSHTITEDDPQMKITTELNHEQQEKDFELQNEQHEQRPPKRCISLSSTMTGRLVAVGLMIVAGCCVALQAGFNATLNAHGGRSFASLISFAVGLAACLSFFAFDVTVLKTPRPTSRLKEAPWYAWAGGVLGSYYVIINVLCVPKLGAATVLSVFVCSQVITACVIDHFGLVGVAKRKYTIWRILGSLGLVGCVAVITIF
ncbi:hypothetical protein BCR42DRAFT_408958 [Absidia repens]|uniref:EamA domain-containing protein n=1 Tax=Absidia repens TaxID=90262 RepID=A0A1X2IS04_9FUNG|nr:hypothetical protein BCR42DRAFT_408958 [Absidia repens]